MNAQQWRTPHFTLDVKHVFPAILALKMLCVHPVLILRKAFMKDDSVREEDPEGSDDQDDSIPDQSDNHATLNPQD